MEKIEINYLRQKQGPLLGWSSDSELTILEQEGKYFKNLSKSGRLEAFEDWRRPSRERAKDLAARLSVEEMAGLMVYSSMNHIPNSTSSSLHGRVHTFRGKLFEESGADEAELSDQLKDEIAKKHLRHFFLGAACSGEALVEWNNRMQALAEKQPYGIPCIKGTDQRHSKNNMSKAIFGLREETSVWNEGIGMAATFDTDLAYQYGKVVAKEFRSLGIQCILGPQIDLSTDPRWPRYGDTYGPNVEHVTEFARAITDGFQTSEEGTEIENGWGYDSICAMVKHWPGGGTGEGGRDAHYGTGKYAVYPGNNFDQHLRPFTEGALRLRGRTKQAGAVMPYYTISTDIDAAYGENVGNGFSRYIINDLLRDQYGYDGIVCSDWEITPDTPKEPDVFAGKCWGTENMTIPQRMAKALRAGVNQFGGLDSTEDLIAAWQVIADEDGEESAERYFRSSCVKLLENIFRLGMFENPYVDYETSKKTVGCMEFRELSRKEQEKSAVLLKNQNHILPLQKNCRLFAPQFESGKMFSGETEAVEEKFVFTSSAKEAEAVILFLHTPAPKGLLDNPFLRLGAGYDRKDAENGGNGYIPISLQYRPYNAKTARKVSLAGDVLTEGRENRSYHGKTAINDGEELKLLEEVCKKVQRKPIIVILQIDRPVILSEFERNVQAILVDYGMEKEVLMEILTGERKPGGRLPYTIPSSMENVENHKEDTDDLSPYVDETGNNYDFGFGLSYTIMKGEENK